MKNVKRKSKHDTKELPCWLCALLLITTTLVWATLVYQNWLTPTL